MDVKITLSFNSSVVEKAKQYAGKNNISLSRLTEFLLQKVTSTHHQSLEDLPISDWVNILAEGPAEYKTKPRKAGALRQEYFKAKK